MNPALLFLLLFAGIPLLELYFLIQVGAEIGAIPTIFLTVFTAVLGGLMVRLQGFSTALKVREAMDRDQVPAIEMIERFDSLGYETTLNVSSRMAPEAGEMLAECALRIIHASIEEGSTDEGHNA